MRRIGIMLAGGEASRLPNKPLLPTIGRRMVIESGLGMLWRSGCQRVVVVVRPRSFLPDVMTAMGIAERLDFVEQYDPGVIGAVKNGAAPLTADQYLVTFCDNIFDTRETVDESLRGCHAAVRRVDNNHELDGWSSEDLRWRDRRDEPDIKLAGWYLLPTNINWAQMDCAMPSTWFLNAIDAKPVLCVSEGWHDVGTEASYLEYLRDAIR